MCVWVERSTLPLVAIVWRSCDVIEADIKVDIL
jgi:hypothetical protein